MGSFRLEPRVRLQTHWQAPHLQIQLLRYRLPGLEKLEGRIRYSFQAEISAAADGLDLQASAALECNPTGLGVLLPLPVVQFLGERLLIQILERLQQRCQRLLPPAIASWAEQQRNGVLVQAVPAAGQDSITENSITENSGVWSASSL